MSTFEKSRAKILYNICKIYIFFLNYYIHFIRQYQMCKKQSLFCCFINKKKIKITENEIMRKNEIMRSC